ncbi:MAG TPA: hypothetical protein VK509_05075 [Polyangiales bacterium]|nr:hypothetical protein [Polyangiales bacterium]
MSLKWVAVGLLAAGGCVMSGYDRAPLPAIAPPGAGQGGSSSPSGSGGSDATRAGSGGMAAGRGGTGARAGSSSAPVVDVCDQASAGARCNDGKACTENDVCAGGFCQGKPKACPFTLNDCTPVVCVEEIGECSNTPVPDLTICGFGQVNQCVAGLCTVAEVCDEEPCEVECDDESCLYECPGAALCQPVCERSACYFDCQGATRCQATCEANTRCTVDCRDAEQCAASCADKAGCVIDCRGAGTCKDVMCLPGAQCSVQCSPGASCAFSRCDTGPVSCGLDRIGCGGCPE